MVLQRACLPLGRLSGLVGHAPLRHAPLRHAQWASWTRSASTSVSDVLVEV